MNILLISPSHRDPFSADTSFHLPPLSLAQLAGMTPDDIHVSIIDEQIQPVDFNTNADLVGITVKTKTAKRAYEIANTFRHTGTPVVLGGIHPTVSVKEAGKFADAVVIGEAEPVWMQLLNDCKHGRLDPVYHSAKRPDLEHLPIPDRTLFQKEKYDTINLIQTTRGCPYSCHFCSVSSIYGRGIRSRPVDDVILEIGTLEGKDIFFVDDNIIGNQHYSKQLLTALQSLQKKWFGMASVTVADNKDILKLLQKSGCQALFIGFETTVANSLMDIGKPQNTTNNYFDTINKLHDHGICVFGAFVLGFDRDDETSFKRLLDFSMMSNIDVAEFSILMPNPGTVLYQKLKQEKRLLYDNWWLQVEAESVVHDPKLLTKDELHEGWVWTLQQYYKIGPIFNRWIKGVNRRSLMANILAMKVNMGCRKRAYNL